eukprot:snap_masked-scaffold_4-processed-gene-2.17-mRNA-1 protein AED:1.00 eAED:1.00 QI:0/0/0/0/1/1/2/0/60
MKYLVYQEKLQKNHTILNDFLHEKTGIRDFHMLRLLKEYYILMHSPKASGLFSSHARNQE